MEMSTILRAPGLNERRCIVRHALKFYHGLTAAGLYDLTGTNISFQKLSNDEVLKLLAAPLSACVREHPILSVLIHGQDAEKPMFVRAKDIDVRNHVRILKVDQFVEEFNASDTSSDQHTGQNELLRRVFEHTLNDEFEDVSNIPPWKVHLIPLPAIDKTDTNKGQVHPQNERIMIAFTFSHSHGDGLSGLLFHQTFSKALEASLKQPARTTTIVPASDKPLPEAVDHPKSLPISWSYLFSTILDEFIPKGLFTKFNPVSTAANS